VVFFVCVVMVCLHTRGHGVLAHVWFVVCLHTRGSWCAAHRGKKDAATATVSDSTAGISLEEAE